MTAAKVIELDFAKIEFFENYGIVHVKEDTLIDTEHLEFLKELFDAYFEDKPYVYIADRSARYNINPIACLNFDFSNLLKGVAIVTWDTKKIINAEFEGRFIPKPFLIFQRMDDAVNWANIICDHS